jgi:hypothetical protein
MTDIEKRAEELYPYKDYNDAPALFSRPSVPNELIYNSEQHKLREAFIKGYSEGYEKGKEDKWISVKDRLPTAYEPGEWDGLRSDFVLTKNKKGHAEVARVYTGILDGDKFANWFTTDDYELLGITQWREIN